MNCRYTRMENTRQQAFETIWSSEIPDVFSDIAKYYDRANDWATAGLLARIRKRFISTIDVRPNDKVLDVCAGTNVIGINLLKKEPTLDVHAIDRSEAMQEVGRERAEKQGFKINSTIQDVHTLPFPDNHFDVVTLQWATRHLRVIDVFSEIQRVLKPGGRFYHCDMLRPADKMIERLYYAYLKVCLTVISYSFGCGQAAMNCRKYFVDAIRLFYSTDELTGLINELGFVNTAGLSVSRRYSRLS